MSLNPLFALEDEGQARGINLEISKTSNDLYVHLERFFQQPKMRILQVIDTI